MRDDKYNGWSNYATWRVNLELFDHHNDWFTETTDPYNLSDELRDYAIDVIIGDDNSIKAAYAIAFMQDVNWVEIASHLIEQRDDR